MLQADLNRLLEGTTDAAFTLDMQGLICSWNTAAEKLFGYSAEQVLHKPCATLLQGVGSLGTRVCAEDCAILASARAHREIPNYDLYVKVHDGQRVWLNVSTLVYEEQRTGKRVIVHLARDISDRKQREHLTDQLVDAARQLTVLAECPGCHAPIAPLTSQETRILRLLSKGQGPHAVTRQLHISLKTLRNHLHHVNRKLDTSNRLEAITHARKRGLI
jgi:PAS domain S-box-containing protein